MNKLVVITAPSGAGKTTIVRHLLTRFDSLAFSVSATTRRPRPGEAEGRDYYFLSQRSFQEKITAGAFVEWEEVYEGLFYGTLKAELERLWAQGKDIIFDIDVKGALNIKQTYPGRCLSIFVAPPSLEILQERLKNRDTENTESLNKRLDKAEEELSYQDRFDRVLVNDDLGAALGEVSNWVEEFLADA